jgi:hypothetical protein
VHGMKLRLKTTANCWSHSTINLVPNTTIPPEDEATNELRQQLIRLQQSDRVRQITAMLTIYAGLRGMRRW